MNRQLLQVQLKTLRKFLRRVPTSDNAHALLDFYNLKAYQADTNEPVGYADGWRGYGYYVATLPEVGRLELVPRLGVAVVYGLFHERIVVTIPPKWVERLERTVAAELAYK